MTKDITTFSYSLLISISLLLVVGCVGNNTNKDEQHYDWKVSTYERIWDNSTWDMYDKFVNIDMIEQKSVIDMYNLQAEFAEQANDSVLYLLLFEKMDSEEEDKSGNSETLKNWVLIKNNYTLESRRDTDDPTMLRSSYLKKTVQIDTLFNQPENVAISEADMFTVLNKQKGAGPYYNMRTCSIKELK